MGKLRSAASGGRAEDLLDVYHRACESHRIAIVRKVGTPMRVVGRGAKDGAIEGVYTRRSTVDYLGWTLAGRVVAIEAKAVQSEPGAPCSFPIARIKQHQRCELESVYRCGGIAMVALFFDGVLYAIPWSYVRLVDEKAIARDQIRAWKANVPLYLAPALNEQERALVRAR